MSPVSDNSTLTTPLFWEKHNIPQVWYLPYYQDLAVATCLHPTWKEKQIQDVEATQENATRWLLAIPTTKRLFQEYFHLWKRRWKKVCGFRRGSLRMKFNAELICVVYFFFFLVPASISFDRVFSLDNRTNSNADMDDKSDVAIKNKFRVRKCFLK